MLVTIASLLFTTIIGKASFFFSKTFFYLLLVNFVPLLLTGKGTFRSGVRRWLKSSRHTPSLRSVRGRRDYLRGTPVRDTWWEHVLIPPPEPEMRNGNQATPGLRALLRPPAEGRLFPPGHPHQQSQQETTLEEQQAARRP